MDYDKDFTISNDLGDGVMAELSNGDCTATIVIAEEQALDGWNIHIFPTLSKKHVVVGISRTFLEDILGDLEGDDLKEAHAEILTESMQLVHNYFLTIGE
jgi:hypothetical protein